MFQVQSPVRTVFSGASRSSRRNKPFFARWCRIAGAATAVLSCSAVWAQQASNNGTGLTGDYFANLSLRGTPSLTRLDSLINFAWLLGSPDSRLAPGNFSVRWTGQLEAPASGDYTFAAFADDGVRLFINGQQVINSWNNHSPNWLFSTSLVTLQAGRRYEVVVEYYDQSKLSYASLWWGAKGSPGVPWSLVPTKNLYPRADATTGATTTPIVPTNLRVAGLWANASTDVLGWDAVPGAASYNLYQYDLRIATGLTNPVYTVPTNLWASGLTYTVTAVMPNGDETAPSNIVTAQGANSPSLRPNWMPSAPSVPISVTTASEWNAGKPRIRLAWQGQDVSYTYNVYRNGARVAEGVWGLQYVDTNVRAGETYRYSVSGVNVPWAQSVESARSGEVVGVAPSGAATSGATVVVTQVTPNDDSATLTWEAVPGAVDYRIYNTAKPTIFKYSGGGLSIEMNGLAATGENTLVVEAVDKLGPFQKMDGFMGPGAMDHNGQNTPQTINGQGDPSNLPNVIGRSAPVSVTCRARSLTGAQAFFDNFRNSQTFVQSTRLDAAIIAAIGGANNAQNGSVREWQNDKWVLRNYWGDMENTRLFVMSDHFMETLYDGGTPRSNIPIHNNNASFVMMPKAVADLSGGKVLHVTFEVDAHFNGRRWCDVFVAAANDPLLVPGKFAENNLSPTTSGNLFRWEVLNNVHTAELFNGKDASGNLRVTQFMDTASGIGADNFGPTARIRWDRAPLWNGTTQDLDKRHKFDLYLSKNRFRIYENGQLLKDKTFPAGVSLPFDKVNVYFVHQLYHTGNDRSEMVNYSPSDAYWYNHRPWADERHWDNMGFEVLNQFPAGSTQSAPSASIL